MTNKTIKVDYLARVEGEGAMVVRIKNGRVADVKLKIFEPPRFFEAFLRGRSYMEAPDITARICGICPVAYQMSAVHAMEDALAVAIPRSIRELRRLIYCGEWIESHALHIFMLHAPDFLGYPDAIRMAKDHPKLVQQGLELKKLGNEIISLLAGRAIHPVNVRVGGFYRVPARQELAPLAERLKHGCDACRDDVRWTRTLPMREYSHDTEFVALRHPTEYPMNEGRLVSSRGLDIHAREYDAHFEEEHVAHSNALHSVIKGRGAYLTGPLARYNLNRDRLPASVQEVAREVGLAATCRNPFESIIVRALEMLYAFEEAIRVIAEYEPPEVPAVACEPRAATGTACTEAPRGSLYHRYTIDAKGIIQDAKIVPPTSQNQKAIEDDLRQYVAPRVDMPTDQLRAECEQAIRNYDPCISCATHFLKLEVEREP
ncbi:MAG: Ni/Fe hydrogenase subunit alpha [Planctomycetes bacterium]|nr:Ni/Fe hydrogenase subunit alpha [Planctomycetota bacterium]